METQFDKFSKADLQKLAINAALMRLVGGFYRGEIGEATVRWTDDGGIEVFTPHQREEWPAYVPVDRATRRKRRA